MNEKVHNEGNYKLVRRVLGSTCYLFAFLAGIILVKTELRKWIVFAGEPSSANTFIFWISLIATILFAYLGTKIWHKKATRIEKSDLNSGDKNATL